MFSFTKIRSSELQTTFQPIKLMSFSHDVFTNHKRKELHNPETVKILFNSISVYRLPRKTIKIQ